MQNFYGRAIRDNKGDAKAMARATRAILKHYISTLEVPQHEDCPDGSSSWCSYQRDRANGTRLHKPIKDPLCPAIVSVVQPIFERLGNENFLAGCENCVTQNANESLHHVIWSLAPKDMSNSTKEISTAISMGVLMFNSGFTYTLSELLTMLNIKVKPMMLQVWEHIDRDRIYMAEYRDSDITKKRRKQKKKDKLKREDAFVHAEGETYKSEAFYGENKKGKGQAGGIKRKQPGKKKNT